MLYIVRLTPRLNSEYFFGEWSRALSYFSCTLPPSPRYFDYCSFINANYVSKFCLQQWSKHEDKLVDMSPAPCIPVFYLLCIFTFNNVFQTDIFVNKSMSKD